MSLDADALSLEGKPPLPRGRHRLSAEEVRSSQRARLLAAMLECVGEDGYAGTTVPQVVARARVSRNAFYELFEDKLDCFLALSDELAGEMLEQIQPTEVTDWISALRSGVRGYLEWWQERPSWTRTYLVEAPTAGPLAIAQRERQYRRFREMFEALAELARSEQPALPALWPLATTVIVHSVTELIADRVRAGSTSRLTELEDDVVYLIVLLLADEATARRELHR
jgi:AcrR family transcriptional regulator